MKIFTMVISGCANEAITSVQMAFGCIVVRHNDTADFVTFDKGDDDVVIQVLTDHGAEFIKYKEMKTC